MDMSAAYEKGVRENCRTAQVVFDKFHVICQANQAVDQVRRKEVRVGGPGVWEALNKSQWLWCKNPEHLTDEQKERMAQIRDKNLMTAKAYRMRLVLQDIYRSPDTPTARRRFQVWCRWVGWAARFCKFDLLASMVKVAQMVKDHLKGILAHWKWGLTNAGIQMQQPDLLGGGKNVALSGRVYVQADASYAPIQPGEFLTTSATPGYAMKVTDHVRAQGAILGKAMTGLDQGKGMVLVLVTLQ